MTRDQADAALQEAVLAWTRRAERFTCLAEARVFELQAGIALNA